MTTANPLSIDNNNNIMDSIDSIPFASAPMEPKNVQNDDFVPFTPDGDRETFPNEIEGCDDEKKDDEPHYPVLAAPKSVKQMGNNNSNKEIVIKSYDADLAVSPSYRINALSKTAFNAPMIVGNLHKFIDTGMKMNMTPKRIEQFNNIIFQTSIKQRQKIKKEYHKLYHEDLMNVIGDKFKFNKVYKEILSMLMMDRDEMYTHIVDIVIHSVKDVKLLSALLCIHYNKTLRAIERIYNARHGQTFKNKVQQMTSNMWGQKTSISQFLWNIVHYKRDENEREVDMKLVKQDASSLLVASISDKLLKKENEHKKLFHAIFTQRSFSHLYFVIAQFEESSVSKLSLYAVVMNTYKATKDKMFYAIGCIILYLTKRDEFYADLLGNSIYRHGPSYCLFLRLIVERHDIDLKNVIDKYGRMALEKWIKYDFEKRDKDAAFLVRVLCGLPA